MSFANVETALVELTEQALGNTAKVDMLPGDLRDATTLREMVKAAPAVYWAFLGGRQSVEANDVYLNTVWGGYFVTRHASRRDARRLGDKSAIGAYEMMQRVLPAINGHTIDDVGSFVFQRVENLFNLRVDKEGAALYAATFQLPMVLAYEADTAGLADFLTYHADHSLVPGDDEPTAIDQVTLPQ